MWGYHTTGNRYYSNSPYEATQPGTMNPFEYRAQEDADLLLRPKISVIGVGGGGSNTVNNMIQRELVGVEYIVCNTDVKSLKASKAKLRVQLGPNKTRGMGAGSDPEVGREAASESIKYVMDLVQDSNMVFLTAGMGGGTGSGAAPIIANACKSMGILTVGIVTLPFAFEGKQRMKIATTSLKRLMEHVDTCIVISNENLCKAYNGMPVDESFNIVDNVLYRGVKGITDLIIRPGLINCDFADVKKIMSNNKGTALMGSGEASGPDRAIKAVKEALEDPLLDISSLCGAKRALVNVTSSDNIKLREISQISRTIHSKVDSDGLIIFGVTLSEEMEDNLSVSVIFTDADVPVVQEKKELPTVDKKSDKGSKSFFESLF